MNGQWIGKYLGTNSGLLVVELDDVDDHYEGFAYAYLYDISLPSFAQLTHIPKNENSFSLRIPLVPLDRQTGNPLSAEVITTRYPWVTMPRYADTEWALAGNEISIKWTTDAGTRGEGRVAKSSADRPSELIARSDITSWTAFREYASSLRPYHSMFRGQENNTWRLRTSFHRTGRAAIPKFLAQDMNVLHRHLSGLTTHRFNLSDSLDNASFLDLVRHHGYPTPLLDWTLSPFIAVYFAYRNLRRTQITPDQKVRILVFDKNQWLNDFERASVLNPAFLHITILEPLAINNPRAVPQQSIASVTNIDDIETYIREKEIVTKKTYLTAIDLPAIERRSVMQELSLMGINAGSLFPGLDGACDQVKERFFNL